MSKPERSAFINMAAQANILYTLLCKHVKTLAAMNIMAAITQDRLRAWIIEVVKLNRVVAKADEVPPDIVVTVYTKHIRLGY